tara:strand:- start:779 stop:1726 length:948 start_codon:yes stop_codon:yes gene_type:complete
MVFAAIFPGQGSQSVGMMQKLYQSSTTIQNIYEQASAFLGYDLWKLTSSDDNDKLSSTIYTQPAMLVAGIASWNHYIDNFNIKASYMAGHSLGEYTALVCSGAIDFKDALSIVKIRAELMQNAVPDDEGAMAAIIGLEDKKVIELCDRYKDNNIVDAVNFNAPGQVVIAGEKKGIEKILENAKDFGAKRALLLNISVPSHCSLMDSVASELREKLNSIKINEPKIPVLNNIEASVYKNSLHILDGLSNQVRKPVKWTQIIQFLIKQNINNYIEFGPGGVLTGLNKRIDRSIQSIKYDSPDSMKLINQSFFEKETL